MPEQPGRMAEALDEWCNAMGRTLIIVRPEDHSRILAALIMRPDIFPHVSLRVSDRIPRGQSVVFGRDLLGMRPLGSEET